MDWLKEITCQIELHSPEGIRNCFAHGINPNDDFRGRPLIEELISEYTRSPRFKDCVQVFVDHGLRFEDKALLSVLLNNAEQLESFLRDNPALVSKKYSFRCAYTPMHEVTLLHICAEFNHLACAEVLVKYNADINSKAGCDEYGFGGQTAIFHTVNQNSNQSSGMLDFLLSHDADLQITVKGLIWGKGYEWETLIPAVTPVSYAMMGLLPQMHRDERTIDQTVSILLKKAYEIEYSSKNIPNAYLKKDI
jgi:hypothetical protein